MTFDIAFERLMGHEGGYVNDPQDPGGETKWGISKRSYPHVDIKNLTRDDAKGIYYRDFWAPIKADQLLDGVAFQLLDFAINSGIGTAVRHLQQAVGAADDGHWGPESQKRLDAMTESDVIMLVIAERLEFMTYLKNWTAHGKGWVRRMAGNLRYGAIDS
jgi:lysozyme family protein